MYTVLPPPHRPKRALFVYRIPPWVTAFVPLPAPTWPWMMLKCNYYLQASLSLFWVNSPKLFHCFLIPTVVCHPLRLTATKNTSYHWSRILVRSLKGLHRKILSVALRFCIVHHGELPEDRENRRRYVSNDVCWYCGANPSKHISLILTKCRYCKDS